MGSCSTVHGNLRIGIERIQCTAFSPNPSFWFRVGPKARLVRIDFNLMFGYCAEVRYPRWNISDRNQLVN